MKSFTLKLVVFCLLTFGWMACHKCAQKSVFVPAGAEIMGFPMNHADANNVEHTDSMFLFINVTGDITTVCDNTLDMGNSLQALAIMLGWDSPLASFKIVSDVEFNGIEPGKPLNDKLWGVNGFADKQSLDVYLKPYMTKNTFVDNRMQLMFKEIPQQKMHRFTLTYMLKNGRTIIKKSELVEWK